MKAKTRIEVFFPDQKSLEAAVSAISHEGKVETDRSQVRITKHSTKDQPHVLVLEITANDIVALRASLNAYLRALQVFEGIKNGSQADE